MSHLISANNGLTFLPAMVRALMMTPALTTPAKIAVRDVRRGMPRTNAARAPVHAPVPGSGMPTKSARAAHCLSSLALMMLPALDSALSSSGLKSFCTTGDLRRSIMGIMGTMLPRTARGKTVVIGRPSQMPTGTAPRS